VDIQMVRFWLRDDQFERIEAMLPGKRSDPGRTAADNRLFVEAVLWIACTGSPWRDLPSEFGLWNRSRGGLSTKIHALVEGLGSLARFQLTGGEVADSPEALPLLQNLQPSSVSADKAYDSNSILDYLHASNIKAVIPPRRNRLVQRPFADSVYC
jgi:transposase